MRFSFMAVAVALLALFLSAPSHAQCKNGSCQTAPQTVLYQGVTYTIMPATMPPPPSAPAPAPVAYTYKTGPLGFFRWRVRSAPNVQYVSYPAMTYTVGGCPGGSCPK